MVLSPEFPPICDDFQSFLVSYDLDILKSTGQVFCRISLNLGLSDISSFIWGYEHSRVKGKVPLEVHDSNMTYDCLFNTDPLVKEASASFLHCEVMIFLFPPSFLGSELLCPAHTQEGLSSIS